MTHLDKDIRSASQYMCVISMLSQQIQRVFKCFWLKVFEFRQSHGSTFSGSLFLICSAATDMASTIWLYPVHLHKFPERPDLISFSVGAGLWLKR